MKKIIATKNAPAAIGPYSQAVQAGNMLFASGQLGLDHSFMHTLTHHLVDHDRRGHRDIQ